MSSLASSFTEEYVTWDKVDSSFPAENISIYVAPGGSGVGVSADIDHTADFGMLARAIKDSEVEALGADYQDFIVARDALTVSVNAENPVCDVMSDMRDVYKRQQMFTERQIDITSMNVRTSKQGKATIIMTFDIHGIEELNRLTDKLRQIDGVIDIERTAG